MRGVHATAARWSESSSAAKYNLQQLDSQSAAELEGKLAGYAQVPFGAAAERHGDGAEAIELSDSAIGRLKHLSEQRKKTQYLRLRVDSGGCYGFSYMLDMVEEPEADDIVIDRDGAKMVIDGVSLPLVRGATIDWRDQLIGQAFYVRANPNASGGCGCGSSFEIKMD
ncbi:[4Fe-4S] proteins maturation [Coemansia biformis]|uniref:[4Fe-4S] proteins maturation n=1 Tax=Coemansia biformis TaxID=1286918 RepID=A0A9W7Y9L0_9FUNG|nr:[4Fe-4S] proteins maturation [Coemansia biformis]